MLVSDEEKVAELRDIDHMLRFDSMDDRRIGFLEGRAFEITTGMDEHPEWWDRGCNCDSCRSYA